MSRLTRNSFFVRSRFLLAMVVLVVSMAIVAPVPAEAKSKSKKTSHSRSHKSSSKKKSSSSRSRSRSKSSHRRGRHKVSHHRHSHKHWQAARPRYAYPYDFFLMEAPDFDRSALPADEADDVMRAFCNGTADQYPARTLVRAGVVKYCPLKGGIFWRREPVKYIIMHSTETGRPIGGARVIDSWNGRGRRHPGAQYVVDRDGTIFQAVDPDLATVHINIFKTLPGINNDNSIGIEMVHAGSQDYPPAQLTSVIRLVNYLQERYNVGNENVITHRYAQQGDHTDPVNFDWDGFIFSKNQLRKDALAYKMNDIRSNSRSWTATPPATLTGAPATTGGVAAPAATVTPVAPAASATSATPAVSPPAADIDLGPAPPVEPTAPVPASQPAGSPSVSPSVSPGLSPAPSAPSTLLQLRGPIEVSPDQAEILNTPSAK
ncbi:MAG: N-acetylmuramoyl-L-alanine amidase [Candidatus Obscuribacterales bacterium]